MATRTPSEPSAPDLSGWPTSLSATLVAVTAATAALTFWLDGVLLGPAVQNGSARGTAAVMGLVACPLLALSILWARKGSSVALLGWLGGTGFLLYNAQLLLYATPFDRLFLLYVAVLALAGWSLALVLLRAVPAWASARPSERFPAHGIAVYAWIVVALNAVVWLRTILPAISAPDPGSFLAGTGTTTNPVFIQDLAVWFPLMVVAATALWRRQGWGRLVVGSMLVMWVVENISVATDQWFAHRADPASAVASAGAVVVFALLAVVSLVPVGLFVRDLRARRQADLEPSWPAPRSDSRTRRVVLEADDFALATAAATALGRAGFDVAQCAGPDATHRCPITVGEPCALLADADVVVSLLDRTDPDRSAVLPGLRHAHPELPVVVPVAGHDPAAHTDAEASGARPVDLPLRRHGLVDAVTRSVEGA